MATEPAIHTEGVRHETRDANIPALTAFGGAIVFTIAIVMLFCWLLFLLYAYVLPMGQPRTPFASSRQLPPEPRLQAAPEFDFEQYIDAQKKELSTYGWVDQQRGVVRIPIARAMDLLLKEGLPVRNARENTKTAGHGNGESLRARATDAEAHKLTTLRRERVAKGSKP